MSKKIKIKNSVYDLFKSKKINEGFFDFEDDESQLDQSEPGVTKIAGYKSVAKKAPSSPEEIAAQREKLWDKLMNRKKVSLENIYGKNNSNSLSNNIFKISPQQMYDEFEAVITDVETGEQRKEIIDAPAEIITVCESVKDYAMKHPKFGPIVRRFDKPIIWTLNSAISTAASDGIRIAYNVIFAWQLIKKGKGDWAQLKASGNFKKGDALLTIGKYWLFVFIHEAYHELYEHTLQAEMKPETEKGKNHHMANTAMDAEINRDIERQLPELKGCTNEIGGIYDPNFLVETWDEIFDQYYYHNKPMPPSESTPPGGGGDSGDDSQQSGGDPGDDDNNAQGGESGGDPGEGEDNGSQGGNSGGNSGKNPGDDNNSQGGGDPGDGDGKGSDSQDGKPGGKGGNMKDGNTPPAPPTTGGTPGGNGGTLGGGSEYDEAYNDELQNIDDKMSGKKPNSTDPKKLSDKEINDIVQGMKDALASGMSMKDLIGKKTQGNPGSNGDSGQKIDAESARKLSEAIHDAELTDLNGTSLNDAMKEINDMTMSEAEQRAREQARKDVKEAMDKMEKDAEMASSSQPESRPMAGKGTAPMPTSVTTSSVFGGSDMVSREDLSKIAESEGQPYTASDLTADRNKINDDYIKENLDSLSRISSELGQKIENIKEKLKNVEVIADWRNKLKKFLLNQSKGEVEQVRSRRVMSQTWRQDRYMPYKDRDVDQDRGAADVFYLIDNSGSMWGAGFGETIFVQIFAEILGIEKKCDIQMSALAYFAGDCKLPPSRIRLWNKKTPKNKVLEMIPQKPSDDSGGTDIGGNITAVTKLKKPYYYNSGEKHTLLIVFTDGEDPAQYAEIKRIPPRYKKDLLFCLMNKKSTILSIMKSLHDKSGVNLSNIICICTDDPKLGKH